jgi:hypothetical protein
MAESPQKRTEASRRSAKPAEALPVAGKSPAEPPASSLFDEELPALDSPLADANPLDALFDDPAFSTEAMPAAATPMMPPAAPPKRPVAGRTLWTIAAAAGAVIALALVSLVVSLAGSDGSERLADADATFRSGAYNDAMTAYDEFLASYPRHADAETAVARRSIAAIHVAATSKQWQPAYDTAVAAIDGAPSLWSLEESAGLLIAPLSAIAAGLAGEAGRRPERATIDKGFDLLRRTEELCAAIDRDVHRLDKVASALGEAACDLQRDEDHQTLLAAMKKASDEGNLADVYRLRREWIAKYPQPGGDADVATRVAAIAQSQRPKLMPTVPALAAHAEEAASPWQTVVLASHQGERIGGELEGRVLTVSYRGAIYGVDASEGRVLWRRFVGCGVDGACVMPVAVDDGVASDILLVDRSRGLLLRVDRRGGQARWALPLQGEAAGPPVVVGEHAWLAEGRHLHKVQLETGASSEHVLLPQPAACSPALDPLSGWLFLPAEQLDLYAIDAKGECAHVLPLGHEAGMLAAPPVVVEGCLVAAVDVGKARGQLQLLTIDPTAASPGDSLRQVQTLPLASRIVRPLLSNGRQVAVCLHNGSVTRYGVDSTSKRASLRQVGQVAPEASTRRIAAWLPDALLIADHALSIIPSEPGSAAQRTLAQGEPHLQHASLQVLGNTLLATQHDTRFGGCVITSYDLATGAQQWRTRFAVPLAGGPMTNGDGQPCWVVNARGEIYTLPQHASAPTIAPLAAADIAMLDAPLLHAAQLSDGTIVASGHLADRLLVCVDPRAPASVQFVPLPCRISGVPTPLANGVLLPCEDGTLWLFDPLERRALAAPLQLGSPGSRIEWTAVSVLGANELEIGDGRDGRYRIAIESSPTPRLVLVERVATLVPPSANEPIERERPPEPLASDPIRLGDASIATGCDGTLHIKRGP